ncbi:MAG: hypothetical protein QM769_11660 [Pseudoxanthomonas sp.]
MMKVLKWVVFGLTVLLALPVGLWLLSRALSPTAEQKRALALLELPAMPEGRNAFPAVWLLPYDVPEDQLEQVAAEDAQRFRDVPLPGAQEEPDAKPLASIAEERFPRLTSRDRDPLRCQPREDDCLDKVRAQPEAYAQWRKDNARLIERVEALRDYDYYRSTFDWRIDTPFPEFGIMFDAYTARAVDFAQGRTEPAVDGVCRDLDMHRKLGKGADSLIMSMIAAAGIHGNAKLLAQMLAELPADYPLPASCVAATAAPLADESSVCNAMRGEAAFSANALERVRSKGKSDFDRDVDAFLGVFYDRGRTEAMAAPAKAWYCDAEAQRMLVDDQPMQPLPGLGSLWRLECAGNYMGCVLSDIAHPAFSDYGRRAQDTGARLKLLGAVLWLREHADDRRPLAQRLASLPDELKSPTREIEIVDGGKALSIRMFYDKPGYDAVFPLPNYLRDATVTN